MVLGPSISIDDWVPELPPKKKQLARQQTPVLVKREPSPDLPPPPPIVDDEQIFVSDEPLPPPPPEAIWPKPESLKNDKFLRNGKEKRLESSFSAVEDVLNREHAPDGSGLFPDHHHYQRNAMSGKSKSLSYIFDSHKIVVPQTTVKSFPAELLNPPQTCSPTVTTNGSDDKQNGGGGKDQFGRSSSVRRNKLTIPNKDYCKSEFTARKSVFQGDTVPAQKVSGPPAFSAFFIENPISKPQICRSLNMDREADRQIVARQIARQSVQTKAVVGPLKSSGAFPPSLEPNCPPTLYQR